MSVTSVKVSNLSFQASERDIKELFSFSGDILHVDLQSEDKGIQTAYVTFKDTQGAENGVLLTGATVGDKVVTITLDPNYQPPPAVLAQLADSQNQGDQSAFQKVEDVVTSLLAKSYIYGRDAFTRAKSFDEKHQLTSSASTRISSFNQRIRLSEKINAGTSVVNGKMKEMDERYQVSGKTKTTYAVVEEKVSTAGSAMMKNPYVQSGATWVSDAYSRMAKAAGEVGERAREKVRIAQEEEKRKMVDDYARVHLLEYDPFEAEASSNEATMKAVSPKELSTLAASPKGAPPMAASPKGASPKAASPMEASPKEVSPKATSPMAASPKGASPMAASPNGGSPMAASSIGGSPMEASSMGASPMVESSKGASTKVESPEGEVPEAEALEEHDPSKAEPAKDLIL